MAQGSDDTNTSTDRQDRRQSRHGSKPGRVEGRPAAGGNAPEASITQQMTDAEKVELTVEDELAKVAFEGESDASVVRRAAQSQRDNVAIVSRRADGTSDQHEDYGLVSVGEDQDLDEKEAAAAENRPERGV